MTGWRSRGPVGPILKYYVYVATQAGWFVIPVWTLFLLASGLSYTEIALLSGVWSVVTVLAEIPTGYVADRVGRRNALLVGAVVQVGCIAAFGLLSSFAGFVAVYVVWGVGETFRSGTDSAWLYDTLAERMDEESFTRVKGRSTSVRLLASSVAYPVGGALAGVDYYLPFGASAAVMSLGILVVLTIPETEQYRTGDVDTFTPREAWPVIRETLGKPTLRPVLLALLAVVAVGWSVQVFTQPIARDVIVASGLNRGSVEPLLGWLYAGFTAVSAVVTYHADAIERRVGLGPLLVVTPAVLGVTFLASAAVPVLAIPTFVVMRGLLKTTDVLADRFVNDHAESLGRATVLSAVAMVLGLGRVPVRLLAGALGDIYSPLWTLGAVGAVLLAVAAGVWLLGPATTGTMVRTEEPAD